MRRILIVIAAIVGLILAVNIIWFLAPVVGSPGVYRPLFAIVLVVVASAAWRQITGKERHE